MTHLQARGTAMSRAARTTGALAVAGALAALTACGGSGGKAAGHTVSPSAASPSAEGSRVVAFEDTYAYEDGLKVKVTRPTAFKPSVTSLGHKPENSPVAFMVTLTNDTKQTFEVAGVLIRLKAGENGDPAEQIFDTARGVGNPLTGSLPPGKSDTATFAFDVPAADTGRLDVEVRPDFGVKYNSVHWTGSAH
ncbi:hypothetical protein QZH56_31520 [Streptomyces olivoreticuli]|uniref:hypothetical protein n=1 Tax=Streptomyces olivoreticuli TaxID=68246 RepID=UPI002658E285|nr:hypothetical protein [Streptomyces olivoreticuli]WKK23220.1 hypothetical protein QZH56_31520 [Streptomyces olivoreticuli]